MPVVAPVCCPYCGVSFEQPPKRVEDCPACHGTVHYETVAGTSERRLMTDAELEQNEIAWGKCDLRSHRRLG
jgi:hypothetical protein